MSEPYRLDLRALTIRQPWCAAVIDGHKLIENRSQGFPKSYRGALLIHAGRQWSTRGQRDARIRRAYPDRYILPAPGTSMATGVVHGIVDLVDIHPASGCCEPWGEATYPPGNSEQRAPGIVTHLVLEHPIRFTEPIPARGALGLWQPDPDLRLEVAHRLADLITWDHAAAKRVAEREDLAQLWHLAREDARARR